jgi:hypothetical protein
MKSAAGVSYEGFVDISGGGGGLTVQSAEEYFDDD